ncbi:hypothetical protein QTN25_007251 [Entamoeba marina]
MNEDIDDVDLKGNKENIQKDISNYIPIYFTNKWDKLKYLINKYGPSTIIDEALCRIGKITDVNDTELRTFMVNNKDLNTIEHLLNTFGKEVWIYHKEYCSKIPYTSRQTINKYIQLRIQPQTEQYLLYLLFRKEKQKYCIEWFLKSITINEIRGIIRYLTILPDIRYGIQHILHDIFIEMLWFNDNEECRIIPAIELLLCGDNECIQIFNQFVNTYHTNSTLLCVHKSLQYAMKLFPNQSLLQTISSSLNLSSNQSTIQIQYFQKKHLPKRCFVLKNELSDELDDFWDMFYQMNETKCIYTSLLMNDSISKENHSDTLQQSISNENTTTTMPGINTTNENILSNEQTKEVQSLNNQSNTTFTTIQSLKNDTTPLLIQFEKENILEVIQSILETLEHIKQTIENKEVIDMIHHMKILFQIPLIPNKYKEILQPILLVENLEYLIVTCFSQALETQLNVTKQKKEMNTIGNIIENIHNIYWKQHNKDVNTNIQRMNCVIESICKYLQITQNEFITTLYCNIRERSQIEFYYYFGILPIIFPNNNSYDVIIMYCEVPLPSLSKVLLQQMILNHLIIIPFQTTTFTKFIRTVLQSHLIVQTEIFSLIHLQSKVLNQSIVEQTIFTLLDLIKEEDITLTYHNMMFITQWMKEIEMSKELFKRIVVLPTKDVELTILVITQCIHSNQILTENILKTVLLNSNTSLFNSFLFSNFLSSYFDDDFLKYIGFLDNSDLPNPTID